jgi:hypothetical protein
MDIASAIQNRKLLVFTYDGHHRTVEPHTVGLDTKGHMAMRAYQIAGGSESGEYIGWKIFHVQQMYGLAVLPQSFGGTRPGYKRGDKAFLDIRTQL